jgi:hypothetical protein
LCVDITKGRSSYRDPQAGDFGGKDCRAALDDAVRGRILNCTGMLDRNLWNATEADPAFD